MDKKNRYIIFKRWIANELLENNFKLIRIEEKKNDGKRSVFVFECTPELVAYMEDFKKRHSNSTK